MNALINYGADFCSEDGAKLLAQQIREFWAGRKDVRINIERISIRREYPYKDSTSVLYCVRSNLVGGLPPSTRVHPSTSAQEEPRP